MSTQLVTPELVEVDLVASDKNEVIRALAAKLAAAGRVSDADQYVVDVLARESQSTTGMPGGIGIPHAKSSAVLEPSLAVASVPGGVDFGAPDAPATLVFLIAAPDGDGTEHLKILASLARKLIHADFKQSLRDAKSPEEISLIINEAVSL